MDAIAEKGKKFFAMVEKMHGLTVSEPLVSGNCIAIGMGMNFTMKGQSRRLMEEIRLYIVKDEKIISEQLFV